MDSIKNPFIAIIYGPTAVGKTALAELIAQQLPVEIINMDVGQFYTPCSIGTAKPNLEHQSVRHHLFDILDKPVDFSVTLYRTTVATLIEDIWQRNSIPLLVGGSGFYMRSLFFPLMSDESTSDRSLVDIPQHSDLWNTLYAIDPDRARQIPAHDTYRLLRALQIWRATGRKPSECKPQYNPIARSFIIHLTRERQQLYNAINNRVTAMIEAGWLDEVRNLSRDPEWVNFVHRKKLIGYDDLLVYMQHGGDFHTVVETIAQRTRNYAKRQETYWRMVEKEITHAVSVGQSNHDITLKTVNLTLTPGDIDLYIKSLLNAIGHYEDTKTTTIR